MVEHLIKIKKAGLTVGIKNCCSILILWNYLADVISTTHVITFGSQNRLNSHTQMNLFSCVISTKSDLFKSQDKGIHLPFISPSFLNEWNSTFNIMCKKTNYPKLHLTLVSVYFYY